MTAPEPTRPATIYTPPEVLRRDPARWPTPAEFVSEWEQHSPERRLYLAERILSDAQKVERLDEAIDRARWERAQAEDAETEATARAEAAEAEVVTLRAQVKGLHEELLRGDPDVVTLRARLAAVEALAKKRDVLYPPKFTFDAATNYVNGYRQARADFRAALSTGEGE